MLADVSTQWVKWLEQIREIGPQTMQSNMQRLGREKIGSLRWLEQEMQRRGGKATSVRNIVYRDTGTPQDKTLLHNILGEILGDVAGQKPEHPTVFKPSGLELDTELKRLFGRERRAIIKRFVTLHRAGRHPRVLLVAPSGAGKTILLDHISRLLPEALRLRLEHDLAPALERLGESLGVGQEIGRLLLRFQSQQPFAVAAGLQHELWMLLRDHLGTRPLLIWVGPEATIAGCALRLPDGNSASINAWLWQHLLQHHNASTVVAFNSAHGLPEETPGCEGPLGLQAPSLDESRRFVRAKLPNLSETKVEAIVRQSQRSYETLGILMLLEAVKSGNDVDAGLPKLRDANLRAFLEALLVACPPDGDSDTELLSALVGQALHELPDVPQAFLEQGSLGRIRPTNHKLVEGLLASSNHSPEDHAAQQARIQTLHRRAVHFLREHHDLERALWHARQGEDWQSVADLLDAHHGLADLAEVWKSLEGCDNIEDHLRLRIAKRTVEHHAALGRYTHATAQDALRVLSASQAEKHWANVKKAEALIDQARFDEAAQVIAAEVIDSPSPKALDTGTRIELALVRAALQRWQGQAENAQQELTLPDCNPSELEAQNPTLLARLRLWRGLIAKDLGQWQDAAESLGALANDQDANPLLRGRAAYQLGDECMRLGLQSRAHEYLVAACKDLTLGDAPSEERSRALARLGTVERRLGLLGSAHANIQDAIVCAPDEFTKARAQSEALVLLAARQEFDAALRLADEAWRVFAHPDATRPNEATYRKLRVQYRTALVYICRAFGVPYLMPMRGATEDHPDLLHARHLLQKTLQALPNDHTDRTASLRVDTHLALALATPDATEALVAAQHAIAASGHAHQELLARLGVIEALLRGNKPQEAFTEINRAHTVARRAARVAGAQHLDDPGPEAWLVMLECEALWQDPHQGHEDAALVCFKSAFEDPRFVAFRGPLMTRLIALLGEDRVTTWPLGQQSTGVDPSVLRTKDALRLRLQAPL